nr:hypothetical protein [Tanacetum cinerariifolium]
RRKRGGSASSTTPPTPIATPTPITTVVDAPRLSAAAKEKQPARATKESFDPIPRTPEDGEDDGDERMHEEEEADELYRDVDINQRRGLQVSQDIDDSHVTLTPIHFDGQESSSTSSFMTSLLNSIIAPGLIIFRNSYTFIQIYNDSIHYDNNHNSKPTTNSSNTNSK